MTFWWSFGLVFSVLFGFQRALAQSLEKVLEDQGVIWSFAFVGDGSIFYTIKGGRLKLYTPRSQKTLEITGLPKVWANGQGGLLEVALAADFDKSKKIYLSYAKDLGSRQTTALGYGTFDGNKLKDWQEIFVAMPGSSEMVHFGGKLLVEKDRLFLTVGDRGVRDFAQSLDNHLGKILQLTPDGKAHPENPFYKQKDVRAEIYSYGHRNPQGIARHPKDGQLWAHEHGPRGGDEINRILPGKNYGWPIVTYGREYHGPKIGEGTKKVGMEDPVYYYVPSIAPSGFVIYEGKRYSGWQSHFILGSLVLTHLNLVTFENKSKPEEKRFFENKGLRIRDVRISPEGWLYFSTDSGFIYRILPK